MARVKIEPEGAGTATYSPYYIDISSESDRCGHSGNPWDLSGCYSGSKDCWWASKGSIRGVKIHAIAKEGYIVSNVEIKVKYSWSNYKGESGDSTQSASRNPSSCSTDFTTEIDSVGRFPIRTSGGYDSIGAFSSSISTFSSGGEDCGEVYHGKESAESNLEEIVVTFTEMSLKVRTFSIPECAGKTEGDGDYPLGSTITVNTEPCCCHWEFQHWEVNGETVDTKKYSYTFKCDDQRGTWVARYKYVTDTGKIFSTFEGGYKIVVRKKDKKIYIDN